MLDMNAVAVAPVVGIGSMPDAERADDGDVRGRQRERG
jgi:hypothetical protein